MPGNRCAAIKVRLRADSSPAPSNRPSRPTVRRMPVKPRPSGRVTGSSGGAKGLSPLPPPCLGRVHETTIPRRDSRTRYGNRQVGHEACGRRAVRRARGLEGGGGGRSPARAGRGPRQGSGCPGCLLPAGQAACAPFGQSVRGEGSAAIGLLELGWRSGPGRRIAESGAHLTSHLSQEAPPPASPP